MEKGFMEYYPYNDQIKNSLLEFRRIPTKILPHKNVKWQYLVLGEGNRTILFLHGMGGAYDIWWQQILSLKDDYQTVSVTYPPVKSLHGLAEGIIEILKNEEIEEVFVVGSSLGGYLAQYLTSFYPDIVKKAVFGNTFPPNDLYEKENRWLIKLVHLLPNSVVMQILKRRMLKNVVPASQNSPIVRAYILEMCERKMNKADLLARYRCVIEKFLPCCHSCKASLMLIESENDPMVPPQLRKTLKGMYNFKRVYTFKNEGHFPYLCAAEEYTKLLVDFFGI